MKLYWCFTEDGIPAIRFGGHRKDVQESALTDWVLPGDFSEELEGVL